MPDTPRERLLRLLTAAVEPDAYSIRDAEEDHGVAEDILLEVLGDPEITKAWTKATKYWWYA